MKITLKLIVPLLVGISMLAACKKDSVYYAYDNQLRSFSGTTYDYIQANANYDSLQKIVDRVPKLKETLMASDITFFVTTNRSFELAFQNLNKRRQISNQEPIYIDDIPVALLETLVHSYAFDQLISTTNLVNIRDGAPYVSMAHEHEMHLEYTKLNASGYLSGGAQQLLFSEMNGSIFERYWVRANTVSVNIQTDNGLIHVLSPDHSFAFGLLNNFDN